MADRRPLSLLPWLALCGLPVATGASAAQPSRLALQDMTAIQELLVGRFDTADQAKSEADAGAASRVALQRVIVPVRAGFIGDSVFYFQETVQGDARRVVAQQLWLLESLPGKSRLLVTTPLALAEPLRWREGLRSPEMFRGILPQDVKPLAGCAVVWRRVAEGFDGATEPGRCRLSTDGAMLRVDQQYQLRASGLGVQERRFDAAGQPVSDEPPLRFQRQAP
ncbi:MAG: hypothetical protein RLZZ200_1327 [Pseudomonadota bacterium]|jgi:hypothetical protein